MCTEELGTRDRNGNNVVVLRVARMSLTLLRLVSTRLTCQSQIKLLLVLSLSNLWILSFHNNLNVYLTAHYFRKIFLRKRLVPKK